MKRMIQQHTKQVISVIMAIVLVITSMPISQFAHATESTQGIGVSNTLYKPDGDDTLNQFKVTFVQAGTNQVVNLDREYLFGNTYLTPSTGFSTFELDDDQTLRLSDDNDFMQNFILANRINEIRIELMSSGQEAGENQQFQCYEPDNAVQSYTNLLIHPLVEQPVLDPETGEPVINPETGNPVTEMVEDESRYVFAHPNFNEYYTVSHFKSSVMTEHTVHVNWLDVQSDSRNGLTVGIDLRQNGVSYITDTPEKRSVCSNVDAYDYNVPMYDENKELYTYTASETLTRNGEADDTYRVTTDASGDPIYNIKRRTFTADFTFKDGGTNRKPSVADQHFSE